MAVQNSIFSHTLIKVELAKVANRYEFLLENEIYSCQLKKDVYTIFAQYALDKVDSTTFKVLDGKTKIYIHIRKDNTYVPLENKQQLREILAEESGGTWIDRKIHFVFFHQKPNKPAEKIPMEKINQQVDIFKIADRYSQSHKTQEAHAPTPGIDSGTVTRLGIKIDDRQGFYFEMPNDSSDNELEQTKYSAMPTKGNLQKFSPGPQPGLKTKTAYVPIPEPILPSYPAGYINIPPDPENPQAKTAYVPMPQSKTGAYISMPARSVEGEQSVKELAFNPNKSPIPKTKYVSLPDNLGLAAPTMYLPFPQTQFDLSKTSILQNFDPTQTMGPPLHILEQSVASNSNNSAPSRSAYIPMPKAPKQAIKNEFPSGYSLLVPSKPKETEEQDF
ncbi:MAG: hypothetical protein KBA81_07870 [Rhabdochlamydiaceae bacterium]|nr:hypothetical protein [Rhabdochlamydiaceae bacterium]